KFPAITVPEAAQALHHIVVASRGGVGKAEGVGFIKAMSLGKAVSSLRTVTSSVSPVEDAAYEANLLLQAFPDTSPVVIAQQVKQIYPGLTVAEAARVLKYGNPYPV